MSIELMSTGNLSATGNGHQGFQSPNIVRKHMSKEALAAQVIKKSRRAKSTEPCTESEQTQVERKLDSDMNNEKDKEKTTVNIKLQETMSKSELINCYRLLMSEKLRLERFLSIVTKNNEMARNRLESDLLDAMMCIEDLKQALELRMARRRKIDPREAEERRYLIRQNKKLLNQLYESAKKIEKLELTKVEMREQLELLDFQILEIENQKTLMEEELRKQPSCTYAAVQTDVDMCSDSHVVAQLRNQLDLLKSEMCHQKAEAAAVVARYQHMENLVRELRRDNVELRDQLAKLDDAENSLAESDKPLARESRELQAQLDSQTELIRELEFKLKSSRDYTENLEARVQAMESTADPTENQADQKTTDNSQVAMRQAHEDPVRSSLRVPHVDDLLLQETIRTFHALIAERDQQLAQLRTHIRRLQEHPEQSISMVLPDLCESTTQTDLDLEPGANASDFSNLASTDRIVLTADQVAKLCSELQLTEELSHVADNGQNMSGDIEITFPQLLSVLREMRKNPTQTNESSPNSGSPKTGSSEFPTCFASNNETQCEQDLALGAVRKNVTRPLTERLRDKEKDICYSKGTASPSRINRLSERPASAPTKSSPDQCPCGHSRAPQYYNNQLHELRELCHVEEVRAQLSITERRCQDLERRIIESNEELARARAEGRATEASLSAARRTEAALRRRLLIAMEAQGSSAGSSRHSMGATVSSVVETRNPVELEAAIIKYEAINNSLTEAAQLDRTRLHEQSLYIGQLEAERRALHDRISTLQATEAAAQRGIVRLQALYEDMLREYSESRNSQELIFRNRERSRSNYRNHKSDQESNRARSQCKVIRGEEQLTVVETENGPSNQAQGVAGQATTQPVGQCSAPSCMMVRQLLQAFQDKFSEMVTQLSETRSCLINHGIEQSLQNGTHDAVEPGDHRCIDLVQSVRQQLIALIDQVKTESGSDSLRSSLNGCVGTLQRLECWLQTYLSRIDTEMFQLREIIVNLQASEAEGEQMVETQCTDRVLKQPFSCSIRVKKKTNIDLLSHKELEIMQLRKQIRELETELQTPK